MPHADASRSTSFRPSGSLPAADPAERQERAKQREAEAERERLQVSVDERLTRADQLSAEQRAELADDAGRAYGPYAPEAWKVRERIKQVAPAEAEHDSAQTGEVSR